MGPLYDAFSGPQSGRCPDSLDQHQSRLLRSISATRTELDDACIPAGPILESRAELVEQLFNGGLVPKTGEGDPPRMMIAPTSQRDQPLRETLSGLRTRERRIHLRVKDQRRRQIRQDALSVRFRQADLLDRSSMSHFASPLRFAGCTQAPRGGPRPSSTSWRRTRGCQEVPRGDAKGAR